ncbi:MAG: biotin--[acetyl-CoA-carboxylase] ligase [Candidatus Omnitrophica bacterium]|nr:biotin--[acetyl-CoA-carboxylase] ligase [Candidatus Omnitrophota bacterium]
MKEFEAKKKIIGMLTKDKDDFVSGEAISRELEISRACVWKYIGMLREEGYQIEASPRRGYHIGAFPDKLYGYELENHLKGTLIGKKHVHYYDVLGSTNTKAYELAEKGEEEGAIVIAEEQTSGKGRLGRKWFSPKSGGIYLSVILRPRAEIDTLPVLSLAAGAAVAEAVNELFDLDAKIKWPNDVFVNGKKIAGILAEIKAQPDKIDFLILGLGININSLEKELPLEGTSLRVETGRDIDRLNFLKCLLSHLDKNYNEFKLNGFVSLRTECKRLSMLLDKDVKVNILNKVIEGKAVDIDEKGALMVEGKNGKKHRIFSGDVTLCREKLKASKGR